MWLLLVMRAWKDSGQVQLQPVMLVSPTAWTAQMEQVATRVLLAMSFQLMALNVSLSAQKTSL